MCDSSKDDKNWGAFIFGPTAARNYQTMHRPKWKDTNFHLDIMSSTTWWPRTLAAIVAPGRTGRMGVGVARVGVRAVGRGRCARAPSRPEISWSYRPLYMSSIVAQRIMQWSASYFSFLSGVVCKLLPIVFTATWSDHSCPLIQYANDAHPQPTRLILLHERTT